MIHPVSGVLGGSVHGLCLISAEAMLTAHSNNVGGVTSCNRLFGVIYVMLAFHRGWSAESRCGHFLKHSWGRVPVYVLMGDGSRLRRSMSISWVIRETSLITDAAGFR